MKAKMASPETAVLTAERKLHNTWVYIKRHWQLYLLFLAACCGADAGVQVRSHGRCADRVSRSTIPSKVSGAASG